VVAAVLIKPLALSVLDTSGCPSWRLVFWNPAKRIEQYAAAVALYAMHYNFVRSHESLRTTPAVGLGVADRVWTLGDLLDAALATQPIASTDTPAKRRSRFRVIQGDSFE